jgi:hypothetical protein
MASQCGENIYRCDAEIMRGKKQVTQVCCTHVLFPQRYVIRRGPPGSVQDLGDAPSPFETARSLAPFLFER